MDTRAVLCEVATCHVTRADDRQTYCTPATDMWSLGVLLYMLVTGGTSPFWAGNNTKTQRKILKAKFTMKIKAFETLSGQIKHLIKR